MVPTILDGDHAFMNPTAGGFGVGFSIDGTGVVVSPHAEMKARRVTVVVNAGKGFILSPCSGICPGLERLLP
jgi:hypothetical protein